MSPAVNQPDDYVWPARSCPDLLELMAVWLRFRTLCSALPHDSSHMWRLPWESRKFTRTRLTKIFALVVVSLGLEPPKGRYWTLHYRCACRCCLGGERSEDSYPQDPGLWRLGPPLTGP